MDASITPAALRQSLASSQPPLVIDVRRDERFRESPYLVKGALRRDPAQIEQWKKTLPAAASVVVYCVHGHEVSQNAAKALGAKYLEGGIEAWRNGGGSLFDKPIGTATRWVTRERPKIDRIACPWLIRRFVDPGAVFLFVPTSEVQGVAERFSATPFDIEGEDIFWTHRGEFCTFDVMVDEFGLATEPLKRLAIIVRGADTARLDLAPEAPGLLAASLGLSRMYADDLAQLEAGLSLYDAFYRWCRDATEETHNWPSKKPGA
jgi:rhodanese-related sulfurtransferase